MHLWLATTSLLSPRATSTTRTVDENTAADVAFGDPVAATDDDSGDTLSYSLRGTDSASFTIVESSGQLKTKASLDYETKASYSVEVRADDGFVVKSIAVTIDVTDVNEAPASSGRRDAPSLHGGREHGGRTLHSATR